MEEDMQEKQKTRAKFQKLLDPNNFKYRLVDSQDVFELPPLPPGKVPHLCFDPKVLPPNSDERFILDAILDSKLHESLIDDLNANGNDDDEAH
jgi:hypothetical protein